MTPLLFTVAVVLLGVAVGAQVAYLRAAARATGELPRTLKVISYLNIGLLGVLAVVLVVAAFVTSVFGTGR